MAGNEFERITPAQAGAGPTLHHKHDGSHGKRKD